MTDVISEPSYVRDAAGYRESMRDGRQVYYRGDLIEDVMTHPATGGGAETIADLYEDQVRPGTQDLLTYVRDDGARATASYFVPAQQGRSPLAARRHRVRRAKDVRDPRPWDRHDLDLGDRACVRAPEVQAGVP